MREGRGFRRRRFLQQASAIGLGAGLGSWDQLARITPLAAAEAAVTPEMVRFRPEIEPVVRWIEETPRDKVFEAAVSNLKHGLSYRSLLAGLFLAGIRNIKPRPVGFKFHAVMVINSAHSLGQTAAVTERLLPLFWALDNFKSSQARDIEEGDWTLGPVNESKLPKPHQAKAELVKAGEAWDVEAADAAVSALWRSAGAAETMEPVWRLAIRDQRNIGHKPIFAAQSWRTLQAIGWENAEPVLRSLVFGLFDLEGDARAVPVGPYLANLENAKKIREDWQVGRDDPGATRSLLEAIRQGTAESASEEAVKLLNAGVAPNSLWDAVILASSELLMASPGIIAIHATTSANSLHYIYGASGDDTNRRLALLQAVGWQPLYRNRAKLKGARAIDAMARESAPSADSKTSSPPDSEVGEIFAAINDDRGKAAAQTLDYLAKGGNPDLVFDAGRRMIFHKGRDSHDYKYGAAIFEEVLLASSPSWRAPLLASSMFNLPGAKSNDSPLMIRAREAVASVMG
ncbi:MAG: hypothetical protein ABS79_05645 [Planctomycetes bacterium SCN 63-9]|nr:MAG: hypothetical protein ABS79_05645 [Planctomycetes bacterium SCN 63-9]